MAVLHGVLSWILLCLLHAVLSEGQHSVMGSSSEAREMRDYSTVRLPSVSETQYTAVFQFGSLVFETLQVTNRT